MPINLVEEEKFIEEDDDNKVKFITTIVAFDHWTIFRNTLVQIMFNGLRARIRQ